MKTDSLFNTDHAWIYCLAATCEVQSHSIRRLINRPLTGYRNSEAGQRGSVHGA